MRLVAAVLVCLAFAPAQAQVGPLLTTSWGQGGHYQAASPWKGAQRTYPGCTTIASAQILNYYAHQATAAAPVFYVLEHDGVTGPDIQGGALEADLPSRPNDFSAFADDLDQASAAQRAATARFIYQVAVTLNAQFGGGEGSSASGRQIENAFRYQWGYNAKARRAMTIIGKETFGYSDVAWADLIRAELDAGRPVLYMAQQVGADAGHAFVIDGYRLDGKVHVNFGWGGHDNGWYDPNDLTDSTGRSWTRDAMIYKGLEPADGYAAAMRPTPAATTPDYAWHGNGSLISAASGAATGYGLTQDESRIHPGDQAPVVFFQWEVDRADGLKIRLDSDGPRAATVTYGPWNDRARDRTYRQVSLPFVLDPARDGFDAEREGYFVVAVRFDEAPAQAASVTAEITQAAASDHLSLPTRPWTVDGRAWNGNGSLIAHGSGAATGYGLTVDEAVASQAPGSVFFQWEVDPADGTALRIEGQGTATLTYGPWDARAQDVTRTVTLPAVIDPAADGLSVDPGAWYVVRVDPQQAQPAIVAEAVQP